MQKRDYFERMIEQIAAAVACAAGVAHGGRPEEAERAIDDAWFGGLGLRKSDAMRLDVGTLRALLGAKAEFGARLLEAQGEVEEARGDGAAARAARRRAVELAGAAARRR